MSLLVLIDMETAIIVIAVVSGLIEDIVIVGWIVYRTVLHQISSRFLERAIGESLFSLNVAQPEKEN